MATYRHKKGKTLFTRLENSTMQDSRISWKARGLLAYMLTKPDNFKFHLEELTKHAPDGLDSVRSGIKELEAHGYINRYPIRVKGKIVSWEMDVHEIPQQDNPQVDNPIEDNPMLRTNDHKKKENIYIALTSDADPYLKLYNSHYREMFGRDHPRVTTDQMKSISGTLEHLRDSGVNEHHFNDAALEHFETLSKNNDGKIFAFLQASYRFFEVHNDDPFR